VRRRGALFAVYGVASFAREAVVKMLPAVALVGLLLASCASARAAPPLPPWAAPSPMPPAGPAALPPEATSPAPPDRR